MQSAPSGIFLTPHSLLRVRIGLSGGFWLTLTTGAPGLHVGTPSATTPHTQDCLGWGWFWLTLAAGVPGLCAGTPTPLPSTPGQGSVLHVASPALSYMFSLNHFSC